MKKRVLIIFMSFIFVLTLLLQANENMSEQVHAASAMKIGDYIQFGQYLGKPILWRVINIDSDGSPMLYSEKILSIKSFDGAESGKFNETGNNPYTTNTLRQKFGSNKWDNSNIREWLNSSDTKVNYSTQPPTKEAVQENAYADEPGFLNNFSEGERNAIKPITHKEILDNLDKGEKDGGTETYIYNENMYYSVQNYDTSYFKNVTDKVYFLDIKELTDYVYKRGYGYLRKPTQEAVTNSEFKYSALSANSYWYYWLRLPCADFSSYVRHVDSDDFVYSSTASYYGGGVVPALNLKSGMWKSGKGTSADPYIPDDGSSPDQLYSYAYSATTTAKNAKSQKSINNARRAISALTNTGASWAIGEFSKQIDGLQQPILVKAVDAINQSKISIKQIDINIAKASIDQDLPVEWKNSYSSAVDAVQQKLMQSAIDAINKASSTKSQADIAAANIIIADIKTAADTSIASWAEAIRKQLISNVSGNTSIPSATTMQIGDYVQFGQYLGKPILWRVINLDSDGLPMLYSEKILCLKPYDASESGKDGQPGSNPYTTDSFRQAYGSNNWEHSNIREWLNSSDKTVTYTTQAPTKSSVNQNSYADEAGFLSYFSESEKNAIKPVTHKAILTDVDKDIKAGGTTKDHTYNENVGYWVQNYDDVNYKNVTDKVYLLDIKELNNYVYNRGFEYIKKPTQEAVNNSQFKESNFNADTYWYYWLRVPCTDGGNGVRHLDSDGFVNSSNASYFNGGIAPALNLKSGTFSSGKGTIDNPYIPDNGTTVDKLYANAYSMVQTALNTKTQKSINDARAAITSLKGTEASWAINEFSGKIDQVQQPILDKANNAIKQAQSSLKQTDINIAEVSIDPDLPTELKDTFISAVDAVQQKLKDNAIAAHNRAALSNSQTDITAANAIITELKTASDASIVEWAANIERQTGIIKEVINFNDKNLELAIRNAINKPTGDLYKSDVQGITRLTAEGKSIADLSGIENLINLQQLNLDKNFISDITPLKGLTSLATLSLGDNQISDLTPLKGLTNLIYLELNNNQISDITPLKGLTNLDRLLLNYNNITDLSIVKGLTNLTWLCIEGTKVSDISPLWGLTKFTNLDLWNTQIRDLDVIALKKALPNCSFYNQ